MDLIRISTPLLAALVASLLLLVVAGLRAAPAAWLPTPVVRGRRRRVVTSVVAVALGVGSAASLVRVDLALPWWGPVPGLGQLLAPVAFGVVHSLVVIGGELLPLGHRRVRCADLRHRDPKDLVRSWLRGVTTGSVVALVATCSAGLLLAAPDGLTIGFGYNEGPVVIVGDIQAGVFPGPPLALPALAAGLLVALIGRLGLRVIADRASIMGVDNAEDHVLRRGAAHRLVRGTTATVLVVVSGLVFFGGASVVSAYSSGGLHVLGWVTVAGGVLTGLLALVVLCSPAPSIQRPSSVDARSESGSGQSGALV